MKSKVLFSRYDLLWAITAFYLLPLVSVIAYNVFSGHEAGDWNALSIGLFLAAGGALILFWLMAKWENALRTTSLPLQDQKQENSLTATTEISPGIDPEEHKFTKLSLEEAQNTQIKLLSEIDTLTEELRNLKTSKEQEQQLVQKATHELQQVKSSTYQQLEQQQNHIRELQATIAEQTALMEKKQHQMGFLESKVGDLTYEIKTLLQLAEAHSGSLFSTDTLPESAPPENPPAPLREDPPIIRSENPAQISHEASQQLKRCLDIAQRITGSQRFGSQLYSLVESPADSFTLDLRRLCDRLRAENSTILLYSPKEGHLLFASNQVRDLTGWSPDKFVKSFGEILHDESQWKQGVSSLAVCSEAQIQLDLNNKAGQHMHLNAHLGMIPSGIFRHHIIAVLIPSNIHATQS